MNMSPVVGTHPSWHYALRRNLSIYLILPTPVTSFFWGYIFIFLDDIPIFTTMSGRFLQMWRESLQRSSGGGAAAQRGAPALFERVRQYYALANEEDYRKNGQWHLGHSWAEVGDLVRVVNLKWMWVIWFVV